MLKKVIFAILIFFSLFIRLQDLGRSAIGYHNMKENEYICIANNMYKSGDYISRNVDFYNAFTDKSKIRESFNLFPQIPFISYFILLSKLLGFQGLWLARLINIIVSLLAIFFVWRISDIIFRNDYFSLATAFFFSFMPVSIYYSSALQPEFIAMLFSLVGIHSFLKFCDSYQNKYCWLLGTSLALTLAAKLPFLIMYVPLIFIFPYRKFFIKLIHEKKIGYLLALLVPTVLLIAYWKLNGQLTIAGSVDGRMSVLTIFTAEYWQLNSSILKDYVFNENFGVFYTFAAVLGLLLGSLVSVKDFHPCLPRLFKGVILAILLYMLVFYDYINKHNYYQMPFLFFLSMAIAYLAAYLDILTSRLLKCRKYIFFCVFFISITLASYTFIRKATNAMFAVKYYGAEVLGDYMGDKLQPGEKFLLKTIWQGFAVTVNSGHESGWLNSLEALKGVEKRENIRYVCFYPISEINSIEKKLKDYILKNYSPVAEGLISLGSEIHVDSLVLLKNGHETYELSNDFNVRKQKVYQSPGGPILYTVRERAK